MRIETKRYNLEGSYVKERIEEVLGSLSEFFWGIWNSGAWAGERIFELTPEGSVRLTDKEWRLPFPVNGESEGTAIDREIEVRAIHLIEAMVDFYLSAS